MYEKAEDEFQGEGYRGVAINVLGVIGQNWGYSRWKEGVFIQKGVKRKILSDSGATPA